MIHAISTGDGVDGELIEKIELCAKEKCRSARRISSNLPIEARPDGSALMIGQAQFDELTLSNVTVEVRDFRSGPLRRVSIDLSDDGQANKPHGDALILLDFFRDRACRENCLRIRRASLAYRLDDVRYLFYSPDKGVRANIDHGITLDIPARALDVSMIVYASSRYGYGSFPSLELFPGMVFKKPVSVIYDLEFFEGRWKLDFFEGRLSEDGRKFEIEVNKSGRVKVPVRGKTVGVKSPVVGSLKEEFDLCLQFSRSHRRNRLSTELFSKGWSAMNDCGHLHPYVHLFVVGGFVGWGIDVVYNSTEVRRG
ncbi:MAG: hypothetical protein Q4E06_02700 [Lautropia sp.]|nr:hypothetical protein [Lautropia sp.]